MVYHMKRMTERVYMKHCDEYNGICTKCGAIRHGETEPDAEGYPCRKCETDSVVGIENAMIMGLVEII